MPHDYHQFKTMPFPEQNFHITKYCNATAVKGQLIKTQCQGNQLKYKMCDINLSTIQ